jgi:hypothetical protein
MGMGDGNLEVKVKVGRWIFAGGFCDMRGGVVRWMGGWMGE